MHPGIHLPRLCDGDEYRSVQKAAPRRPPVHATGSAAGGPDVGTVPSEVDAVRRRQPSGRWYPFVVNHGGAAVVIPGAGPNLPIGERCGGMVQPPSRGVVVQREGS